MAETTAVRVPIPRGMASSRASLAARLAARLAMWESVEFETPSHTTSTAKESCRSSASRAMASSLRPCRMPMSQTPATQGCGSSVKWSRGSRCFEPQLSQ